MKSIFSPNKTSAKLLVDCAAKIWNIENGDIVNENIYRYLMVYDLYIKARSYAMINKIFFFIAVITGIVVLVWPSIAIISAELHFENEFLKSAVVQTTVTGFAGLAFAVYSHYKKRQMYMENLMRYIIFSGDETIKFLRDRILKEMARIDQGFAFSDSIQKERPENNT